MKNTIRSIFLIFKAFALFSILVTTGSSAHHNEIEEIGSINHVLQPAENPGQHIEQEVNPITITRIAENNFIHSYLSFNTTSVKNCEQSPIIETAEIDTSTSKIPLFVLNKVFRI